MGVLCRSVAYVCAFLVVACGDGKRSEKNPPVPAQIDAAARSPEIPRFPLGAASLAAFAPSAGKTAGGWADAARAGKYAEAARLLSSAAAHDVLGLSDARHRAAAFAEFARSAHGRAVERLLAEYRTEFRALLREAVFVIGRYAEPSPPAGDGEVTVSHNAEVFAYVARTKRFLRITHTGGAVVGFFRDPGSSQLIYVHANELWLARPEPGQRQDGHLRRAHIGVFDVDRAEPQPGARTFHTLRELEVFYAQVRRKRQLVAKLTTARSPGSLIRGPVSFRALNPRPGSLGRLKWARPVSRGLRVAHNDVSVFGSSPAGVAADWGDDGVAAVFRLEATRKTITMPRQLVALRSSMAWSPDRARLAVASRPRDECGSAPADRSSAVFIIDAQTGQLQELGASIAVASPQWLDRRLLAYATGRGTIAIVDVANPGKPTELTTRARATTWLAQRQHCQASAATGQP